MLNFGTEVLAARACIKTERNANKIRVESKFEETYNKRAIYKRFLTFGSGFCSPRVIFPCQGAMHRHNIIKSTVELQWLEQAWCHENWFQSKVVPGSQGKFL